MTRRLLARLLAGLLLLLPAACARDVRPMGDVVHAPELTGDYWTAADGARFPLRVWRPAAPPQAVVLALHGMNDYANAFDAVGSYLAKRGVAVYAYDQRGFGAGPHPGRWSGHETMAEDARTCARLLLAHHPEAPLYLLGESMGGGVALIALAAADAPPGVRGVILSAPGVWGRSTMGLVPRITLWLTSHLVPGMELTGEGLKIMPSDNLEMLRALSADPLVIKKTRVDAIEGVVDLMDAALAVAPRLTLPTLVLYGEKDQVVPPEPTWKMIRSLPGLGRTQRVALYEHGWHMLMRDLQAKAVWNDIAAWLADPAGELPSGSEARAMAALAEKSAH